jgi:cystathionine beta-lyase/cystathionine gamma-synthase
MEFQTRAIHSGQKPDPSTGATIPPLYLSTTFTQAAPGEHLGFDYARSNNPTRAGLEACLASLEGGEACAAFASGLAACSAVFDTLQPGDGVVASHDLYGGTFRLLDKVFRPLGIEVVFAGGTEAGAFERAIQSLKRPRLLWLESPTNPLLDIMDIAALSTLAAEFGMQTAVDNTFATPYLQRPLELGADFAVHSTTKYLGGHSDVIGGAVVSRTAAQLERIRFLQNARGAVPGPLDCYLVQRGVKTLALRMEGHSKNARHLAQALEGTAGIRRVIYPGLPSHPGHRIARKQMRDFGGILSLELEGGLNAARCFCSQLRVFSLAESLGAVESLCCHPATMTHASIPRELREPRGITDGLVRLSVGLEHRDDLLADILQALGAPETTPDPAVRSAPKE